MLKTGKKKITLSSIFTIFVNVLLEILSSVNGQSISCQGGGNYVQSVTFFGAGLCWRVKGRARRRDGGKRKKLLPSAPVTTVGRQGRGDEGQEQWQQQVGRRGAETAAAGTAAARVPAVPAAAAVKPRRHRGGAGHFSSDGSPVAHSRRRACGRRHI